ncbi:hypothetical protein BH09MYX1_BH09MYX1_57970 [soil metagenome]
MKQRLVFAILFALLGVACAKPYTVLHAAVPNPFVQPGCRVIVEDVHMENLQVGGKTDAEYFADKKPEARASYMEDKAAFAGFFRESLAERRSAIFLPPPPPGATVTATPNVYIMRPNFLFWEPGYNVWVSSRPAEAILVIQVLDPSGQQVIDEIRTSAKTSDFSSGSRMRAAGLVLARNVSRYLGDRFICAPEQ